MTKIWSLEDAQTHFQELIEAAGDEPQLITQDGTPLVTVQRASTARSAPRNTLEAIAGAFDWSDLADEDLFSATPAPAAHLTCEHAGSAGVAGHQRDQRADPPTPQPSGPGVPGLAPGRCPLAQPNHPERDRQRDGAGSAPPPRRQTPAVVGRPNQARLRGAHSDAGRRGGPALGEFIAHGLCAKVCP